MQRSKPFKICYDFTVAYFCIHIRLLRTRWHGEARILLEGQGSIGMDGQALIPGYT